MERDGVSVGEGMTLTFGEFLMVALPLLGLVYLFRKK